MLLSAISSFAQADKDSLLLADREIVLDKLRLMRYLDEETLVFLTASEDQKTLKNQTFPYYFTSQIIKNNPSSIDIKKYLNFDYKEFVPLQWKDFISRVYEKNLAEFIELTNKYGYLSFERLGNLGEEKRIGNQMLYVIRNSFRDKEVKKLLRKERKAGNLSELDHDQFKFFLERKTVLTQADFDRMEKKGMRIIRPGQPSQHWAN